MDASTQEALLKDPRVQESIKKAGQNALSDPAVQAMILETCKEKFPEKASQAAGAVKEWAKDPATQEKAKQYAGVALGYAANAGENFMKKLEQGPAAVRFLAFLGGAASFVLSVFALFDVLHIFAHPISYCIGVYQCLFSLTTILFEASPETLQKAEATCPFLKVSTYQDLLIVNAKFLALNGGRGLFYIFQGTLWLFSSHFFDFPHIACGLYLGFIGVIHVLMHFGIMPEEVASKMRSVGSQGYKAVGSPKSSPAAGP